MSPARLRFLAAARQELRGAVEYYDAQLPGLGDEFAAEVERTGNEIAEFPGIGSPHLLGTRQVSVRRFPFSLIYRHHSGEVVVLAVAHHRRRPDYWRRRN